MTNPFRIDVPDQIAYMNAAAATPAGLDYKERLALALDLRPGHAIADLGCGPGTDLGRLAEAAGPEGAVIGIDQSPRMLAEARHRFPHLTLYEGDLHALPLPDNSLDRARVDRVLQHVTDPLLAIREIRRVLRPGGLFAMAEPDWDTLTVADEDVQTSRLFASFTANQVRNPTMGRELVRLCTAAGFRICSVDPIPILFRDFPTADHILGLHRNSTRATQSGHLTEPAVANWLTRLTNGPLIASFTLYLVTAEA